MILLYFVLFYNIKAIFNMLMRNYPSKNQLYDILKREYLCLVYKLIYVQKNRN
jgi:hypothetical protein